MRGPWREGGQLWDQVFGKGEGNKVESIGEEEQRKERNAPDFIMQLLYYS